MLKPILLGAFLTASLAITPCFADVPSEGFYIVKTAKLKQALGSPHDLSNLSARALSQMADYEISISHWYLTSFSLSTPKNEIIFLTDDYSMRAPDPAGMPFELKFKSKGKHEKWVKLKGALVFTDETLDHAQSSSCEVAGMPNTVIRINKEWYKQEFAVISIFVNAKR